MLSRRLKLHCCMLECSLFPAKQFDIWLHLRKSLDPPNDECKQTKSSIRMEDTRFWLYASGKHILFYSFNTGHTQQMNLQQKVFRVNKNHSLNDMTQLEGTSSHQLYMMLFFCGVCVWRMKEEVSVGSTPQAVRFGCLQVVALKDRWRLISQKYLFDELSWGVPWERQRRHDNTMARKRINTHAHSP